MGGGAAFVRIHLHCPHWCDTTSVNDDRRSRQGGRRGKEEGTRRIVSAVWRQGLKRATGRAAYLHHSYSNGVPT